MFYCFMNIIYFLLQRYSQKRFITLKNHPKICNIVHTLCYNMTFSFIYVYLTASRWCNPRDSTPLFRFLSTSTEDVADGCLRRMVWATVERFMGI